MSTTSSPTSPSAADGEPVTLGYNGAPGVPGFGLAAIYTDQQFSLVIAEPGSDEAVACGDILRPDADQFEEAGVAVVQLLPVGSSDVEGIAAIERASLQRELDITPTQVRIVLSTDPVSVPSDVAAGYEGYVQGGHCDSPDGRDPGRARERGRLRRHAVRGGLRRDGRPRHRRFLRIRRRTRLRSGHCLRRPGLLAGDRGWRIGRAGRLRRHPRSGCGRVRGGGAGARADPAVDDAGEAGVQGYAVVQRTAMERELDVTPTLFKVLLFAPPAD